MRVLILTLLFLGVPTGLLLWRCVAALRLHARLAQRAAGLAALEGTILGVGEVLRVELDFERVSISSRADDTYREQARRTTAQRFTVRTSAGERVEVVPSEEILLLDELEMVREDLGAGAQMRARLVAGQQVHLLGRWVDEPSVDGELVELRSPPAAKRVLYATHAGSAPLAALYAARRDHYERSVHAILLVAGLAVAAVLGVWLERGAAQALFTSAIGGVVVTFVGLATISRDDTTCPWYWVRRVHLPAPCAHCQVQQFAMTRSVA